MRASSNPFLISIDQDTSLFTNTSFDPSTQISSHVQCDHEYSVDPSGCITTTLPEGMLLVAYLRLPTASTGEQLIPDNIHVKNAIMYYALYMHYLRKSIITGELKDEKQSEKFLDKFQVLKIKVAGLLGFDIDTMENIKAQRDHLVPRSERYDGFFSQLNRRETENPNMSSYRYYW